MRSSREVPAEVADMGTLPATVRVMALGLVREQALGQEPGRGLAQAVAKRLLILMLRPQRTLPGKWASRSLAAELGAAQAAVRGFAPEAVAKLDQEAETVQARRAELELESGLALIMVPAEESPAVGRDPVAGIGRV